MWCQIFQNYSWKDKCKKVRIERYRMPFLLKGTTPKNFKIRLLKSITAVYRFFIYGRCNGFKTFNCPFNIIFKYKLLPSFYQIVFNFSSLYLNPLEEGFSIFLKAFKEWGIWICLSICGAGHNFNRFLSGYWKTGSMYTINLHKWLF